MAGNNNGEFAGDVENGYGGNRVQPFPSTQMQVPLLPEKLLIMEGDQKKQQHLTALKKILGFGEIFSVNVWRASIAELLGTAVLVFAIDTIVISSIQTETTPPNLLLSTLIAMIVTILLLATFPISGGHINPIVSFSAVLTGLMSITRAAIYILAQCIGGILGALALKAVVNSKIEETFSLGGCTLNVVAPGPDGVPVVIGLETGQALWLEIICSFVFLFASVWMAFDERQAKALGRVKVCIIIGIVLGLLVFVSTTVTAQKGYGGAGLNPARCLGPALIRGGHLWDGHWVFWVGPAIACLGFASYTMIIPSQHFHSY
ncbi:Major intrinsic protein, Aquaporin-like protein [Melia azedarach]|uniref:Major intrinsic protein, Aquaporin-like protein n=1 Tax=Melia azedarach TaxID=155640 RepID=A0ACC1Y0M5_MELAZ|nr:Major intrinsic protein, Aquaporin-like protein [Melia azedarach]